MYTSQEIQEVIQRWLRTQMPGARDQTPATHHSLTWLAGELTDLFHMIQSSSRDIDQSQSSRTRNVSKFSNSRTRGADSLVNNNSNGISRDDEIAKNKRIIVSLKRRLKLQEQSIARLRALKAPGQKSVAYMQ